MLVEHVAHEREVPDVAVVPEARADTRCVSSLSGWIEQYSVQTAP